jgi:transcriptional regulator with XRE-family HTH domain
MEHGDRRYDEDCANHAREVLRGWVEEQGGQEKAAELLDVSQGTISRNLNVASQPTLKVLLLLAKKTGWTLEKIFGLAVPPPPSVPVRMSESQLQRVAEKVAEQVSRHLTPRPMSAVRQPPPAPGRRPPKKTNE